MKKKIFIVLILVLSFMLVNTNNVKAECQKDESGNINLEGCEDTITAYGNYCITRIWVNNVMGFKITLYNNNKIVNTSYFTIPESINFSFGLKNKHSKDYHHESYIKNPTVLNTQNNSIGLSSVFFEEMGNSITSKDDNNWFIIMKTLTGEKNYNEIKKWVQTNKNAYLIIEPIYYFETCHNGINEEGSNEDRSTMETEKANIKKITVLGTTNEIFGYLYKNLNKNNQILDLDKFKKVVPYTDLYNSMYSFYLSENKSGFKGLTNITKDIEKNYNILYNQKDRYAYGMVFASLEDLFYKQCDPSDPNSTLLNKLYKQKNNNNYFNGDFFDTEIIKTLNLTEDVTSKIENLKDSNHNDKYINCCKKPEFKNAEEYPECAEPAKYTIDKAECTDDNNKSSIKIKNNNWGNIFAAMYDGDKNLNSQFFISNLDSNGYTKLFCKEEISIEYPPPLKGRMFKNGFFIWPEIGDLKITSKINCKIFLDKVQLNYDAATIDIDTIKENVENRLNNYNLNIDFYVDYSHNPSNALKLIKGGDSKIKKDNIDNYISNLTNLNDIMGQEFSSKVNINYKLPTTYTYLNNINLKFSNSNTNSNSIYFNQGILPLTKEDAKGNNGKYKATIYFNKSKIGGFNKIDLDDKYECDYSINDNMECKCPYGGRINEKEVAEKYYGKDLTPYLIENKMTCPEAQAKYCFEDGNEGAPSPCPENDKTKCHGCYYDVEWAQLIKEYMNKNSDASYDTAKEKTKDDAIEKVCYRDDSGKAKIIYRTISLDNPFPGKEGKGRSPGINWNAKYLFDNNNKLKSRNGSVNGNVLYNKEPIYVIKLTPSSIQNIRNYNKEHKYNDFSLKCKDNDNQACISTFLHDYLSDIEGECSNLTMDSNSDAFYNCVN